MRRGVRQYLVSSVVVAALAAVAGCSHYLVAERETWRHDAELACLNSGAVPETAGRVRISAIEGPGACGIDYPIKVSELGESGTAPLGYDDEALRPPGGIPSPYPPQFAAPAPAAAVQANTLPPPPGAPSYGAPPPAPYGAEPYGAPPYSPPPPQYGAAPYGRPSYASPQYAAAPPAAREPGAPISINAPGVTAPADAELDGFGGPPHPYYGAPNASPAAPPPTYAAPAPAPASPAATEPIPPLGPPVPMVTASAGPVAVKPAATLACPIVTALDKWISEAVQPAAAKWFRQPVVEIKQISAYSCRGMNGNPNAHISEHAFGNALDIAEFILADGHKVSVQYGWHGAPEEQGFLRDVQAAACDTFTTVLAPGANVYHYNHIHVDLMRHGGRRSICEPSAIPGEVAAARARAHYAAKNPAITGSIRTETASRPLGYSAADDRLPAAVPGED